jgi:quinol-cytochrome oxidoreductase complex cytochrome b subunit
MNQQKSFLKRAGSPYPVWYFYGPLYAAIPLGLLISAYSLSKLTQWGVILSLLAFVFGLLCTIGGIIGLKQNWSKIRGKN